MYISQMLHIDYLYGSKSQRQSLLWLEGPNSIIVVHTEPLGMIESRVSIVGVTLMVCG